MTIQSISLRGKKVTILFNHIVLESPYIIRESSRALLYWNLFLLTLVFYNCFFLPFDFGYEFSLETEEKLAYVRDACINVFYMIDMLM
jgi:hypothetical protein